MSTSYRCFPELPFQKLLDNLPEGISIAPNPADQPDPNSVWLTDGANFVSATTGNGEDTSFERYGGNNPRDILEAVAEKFDLVIVDEHDERFWEGYEEEG